MSRLETMRGYVMISLAIVDAYIAFACTKGCDPMRGQRDFRACVPCHSFEPDRNMTGPSLANLWGCKVGSLPSFERYSDALRSSGIIWDDRSLDTWLTNPQQMAPGNDMPFAHLVPDIAWFSH